MIYVSTKIYAKRDNFDFDIVIFPFLDGDLPRSTLYEVFISQLIRFARTLAKLLTSTLAIILFTQKLLKGNILTILIFILLKNKFLINY